MSDLNKMSGTPWHIEKMHREEGDERRHRSRCIYYDYVDPTCKKRMLKCMGSAHCPHYKEEKAETMKGFLTFVQETLGQQVKEVKLSSNLGSHAVCMTPADGMSFEMEKYMKRANPEFAFTVGRILELNPDHAAVQALEKAMTEDPMKARDYAQLLAYQAQLMADLPLEDPFAYTELVCKLMK